MSMLSRAAAALTLLIAGVAPLVSGVAPASAVTKLRCPAKVGGKPTAAPPSWGFLAKPDDASRSRLRVCARGEGDTLIVEMRNTQRYGVVVSYAAPVKFGWSERGFGLPSLVTRVGMAGVDGLYIAPRSRASVGIDRAAVRGPVTYRAHATTLALMLDEWLAVAGAGGEAAVDLLAKNTGCANLVRATLTDDVVETRSGLREYLEENGASFLSCSLEMEKHRLRRAGKKNVIKRFGGTIAAAIEAGGKVLALKRQIDRSLARRRSYGSPPFFTVVPTTAPAPFLIAPPTHPEPQPAPEPQPQPAPQQQPAPQSQPQAPPHVEAPPRPAGPPELQPLPEPQPPPQQPQPPQPQPPPQQPLPQQPPPPSQRPDRMSSDARLAAAGNEFLQSADGRYRFVMQSDGNLVLYAPSGPIWASNTVGSGANHLRMQGDGNLVIYNGADRPVWASGTPRHYAAFLIVQNDGNVVIYNDGRAIWATGTGGRT